MDGEASKVVDEMFGEAGRIEKEPGVQLALDFLELCLERVGQQFGDDSFGRGGGAEPVRVRRTAATGATRRQPTTLSGRAKCWPVLWERTAPSTLPPS